MTTTNTEIKWALQALRANAESYVLTSDYYEGKQRLAFATDKFRSTFGRLFRELSINHCAVCVDVPADRLQIEGFDVVVDSGEGGEDLTTSVAKRTVEIWRRNRMNKRAGEIHTEALKTGDAYVVVDWVGDKATIFPNQAGRCAVKYDEENPGYINQAARWWTVSEPNSTKYRVRLNLYYKDRIEKYVTQPRSGTGLPTREAEFSPIDEDWSISNPYGKVPVFHFANNADIGANGKSEIKDIIPPQDGLNKAVCDAMVGAEFAALGQRYVIGLEVAEDGNGNAVPPFRDGMDKLWVAPPQRDESGKQLPASDAQPISFGQFNPANLDQLLGIKAAFRHDISVISGIPSHYFMETGGVWPSGESLKTSEQRLSSKVADRQIAFGNVWEDVMRFCLEIEGLKDVQLETKWADTGPKSETDTINNAAVKVEKLGLPLHEAWRDLGYKETQLEKLDEEVEAQKVSQVRREQTVVLPTTPRGSK